VAGKVIKYFWEAKYGNTSYFYICTHLSARFRSLRPDRGLPQWASTAATTFTVDPRSDGREAFVTISTTTTVADGMLGKIQGWLTAQLLRPIYEKELDQLAAVAKERTV
jgi:hypothetical protein